MASGPRLTYSNPHGERAGLNPVTHGIPPILTSESLWKLSVAAYCYQGTHRIASYGGGDRTEPNSL